MYDQSFPGKFLVDHERVDRGQAELFNRLAAEALLEEEQPLVSQDDKSLLPFVRALAEFQDAFARIQEVTEMPDLFPAEEAARLAKALYGLWHATVIEDVIAHGFSDIREDFVMFRASWHFDTTDSHAALSRR